MPTVTETGASLVVNSFDADGCLFNSATYHQRCRNNPDGLVNVIDCNSFLVIHLNMQRAKRRIVFVGSDRQSQSADEYNAKKQAVDSAKPYIIGSCFSAIQHVAEYLGATLDGFLLADAFADLAPGTSFSRATDAKYTGEHACHRFDDPRHVRKDERKCLLLYAQMQKVALENPHEKITFNFYDDRDDILQGLFAFYHKNRSLIPANLTLNLYQYNGQATPSHKHKIIGNGISDPLYYDSVKNLQLASAAQAVDIPKLSHPEQFIARAKDKRKYPAVEHHFARMKNNDLFCRAKILPYQTDFDTACKQFETLAIKNTVLAQAVSLLVKQCQQQYTWHTHANCMRVLTATHDFLQGSVSATDYQNLHDKIDSHGTQQQTIARNMALIFAISTVVSIALMYTLLPIVPVILKTIITVISIASSSFFLGKSAMQTHGFFTNPSKKLSKTMLHVIQVYHQEPQEKEPLLRKQPPRSKSL